MHVNYEYMSRYKNIGYSTSFILSPSRSLSLTHTPLSMSSAFQQFLSTLLSAGCTALAAPAVYSRSSPTKWSCAPWPTCTTRAASDAWRVTGRCAKAIISCFGAASPCADPTSSESVLMTKRTTMRRWGGSAWSCAVVKHRMSGLFSVTGGGGLGLRRGVEPGGRARRLRVREATPHRSHGSAAAAASSSFRGGREAEPEDARAAGRGDGSERSSGAGVVPEPARQGQEAGEGWLQRWAVLLRKQVRYWLARVRHACSEHKENRQTVCQLHIDFLCARALSVLSRYSKSGEKPVPALRKLASSVFATVGQGRCSHSGRLAFVAARPAFI